MKCSRIYLAIGMLVLASIACQALSGGGGGRDVDNVPPVNNAETLESQSEEAPTTGNDNNSNSSVDTDFPVTEDAYNMTDLGDDSLLYYTKLSAEELMDFYRDEYTARGYTEREILTVVSDGTFSMAFDGDPSGKAVVIQSVDLGDGSRTVSIRLEDV